MVKAEWTKIQLGRLQRLIDHPRKRKRWHWAEMRQGGRVKVFLVEARGRLWEFRLSKGLQIRPYWLQHESTPRKTSVLAAC